MRYFFHVTDGFDRPDEVGLELPDLAAVRAEAIRSAGEMVRELDRKLYPNSVWEMRVTDQPGRTILTCRFSLMQP
jgi:hypothetical protein